MTLEEAIIHCESVADRCAVTDGNGKCERDHRQLAEWLRELKKRREVDMEKTYIFTFGVGHKHGGHYVKIKGTYESAREEMFERFGKNWAFQYEENDFFEWHEKHPEVPMETELKGDYYG